MVSATHFNLYQQRISPCYWQVDESVDVDLKKQMSIENIHVLEIGDGANKLYKISMLGLSQNNYSVRVMLRGKQAEEHVISQCGQKDVKVVKYCITDYLSAEEQVEYLKLLNDENVSLCIQYLRRIERRLNLQSEKERQDKAYVRQ